MKKNYLLPILLMAALVAFTVINTFAQNTLKVQTMYDTTRADGQRFIITYPVRNIVIHLADSGVSGPTGIQSSDGEINGYYSLNNSKMDVCMKRVRILSGDTIVRYETITIPLSELQARTATYLESATMKKALKPTAKEWIKRKLKDE